MVEPSICYAVKALTFRQCPESFAHLLRRRLRRSCFASDVAAAYSCSSRAAAIEARLTVRQCADDPCSPSSLDPLPVNVREVVVGQSAGQPVRRYRLAHLDGTQIGDDSVSLLLGGVPAFLRVDGLEYMAAFTNPARWNVAGLVYAFSVFTYTSERATPINCGSTSIRTASSPSRSARGSMGSPNRTYVPWHFRRGEEKSTTNRAS
jgi:hypothetical protein